MKAARYYGPRDIRVEQIDKPVPTSGQALVKVAWNGICGTDLHAYHATIFKFPTATEPDPITGEVLPVTMGHEFSGTIVELGPNVDNNKWSLGQRVVIEPIYSCMKTDTCDSCSQGKTHTCPIFNTIGIGGRGGGLAEFIAVDLKLAHKLPDNVPLEVGACIEPIAVGWHAAKRAKFSKGKTALILGAGPIGLFLLKVLRSIDSDTTIVISEPALLRRQLAIKHGATLALDSTTTNIRDAVFEATKNRGVDVAFDAAGLQTTMDTAIYSVRAYGTVVNIAVREPGVKVGIDMNHVLLNEITLMGTICYDNDHPEVLAAVAAGKIAGIEELISRKIALDDIVEKGMEALSNEKDTLVKILVHP
ncbi:hypothetical protein AX17_001717 [Amanita inopinata Kibby_2008]|nr:hypothetical protein AX17_001717 [Amanita inopinata Kibby_2008]